VGLRNDCDLFGNTDVGMTKPAVSPAAEAEGGTAMPLAVNDLASAAGEAVREAVAGGGDAPGRWVEVLGRAGLISYGALHGLIAALIARAILGAQEYIEIDQTGAVALVAGLGRSGLLLLGVSVAGLVSFGAWQVCAAATGFRWVDGGERTRKRVGAAGKAIAVFTVAAIVVPVLFGTLPGTAGGDTPGLTATLFELPGGRLVVAAIAAVALIVAGSMIYTGVRATFMGDLRRDRLSPALRRVAVICGSAGNLARAAALAGVGLSFAAAAITHDPTRSAGMNAVLRALSVTRFGIAGLVAIATGIAAFGVYCLIDAYARRA
jgi:hypothetical protein